MEPILEIVSIIETLDMESTSVNDTQGRVTWGQ